MNQLPYPADTLNKGEEITVLNNDVAKFFQQCLNNHRLLMCTMAALLAQTHLHQNQMISQYDEGLTPLCSKVLTQHTSL